MGRGNICETIRRHLYRKHCHGYISSVIKYQCRKYEEYEYENMKKTKVMFNNDILHHETIIYDEVIECVQEHI